MPERIKVAQFDEISPGSGKVVEANGQSIALFNVDGALYAIDNTCTHVGGSLGEGDLIDDTVSCPWHGAQFNVKTGEVLGPPAGSGVRSYAVKVEGNDVFVELD
jgi:nitrite reductase/ring-hydroxylating ferredoxin subunit